MRKDPVSFVLAFITLILGVYTAINTTVWWFAALIFAGGVAGLIFALTGTEIANGKSGARLAADRSTTPCQLDFIARQRPDLRVVIAGNPGTSPQTVAFLRSLRDPNVDFALNALGR